MGQQVLGRYRPDTEIRRWGAVREGDVEALARQFVREHGPQAAARAMEWANLMLARGDRWGHWLWRGVLWAIEDMRHRELRAAAGLPLDAETRPVDRNRLGRDISPSERAPRGRAACERGAGLA